MDNKDENIVNMMTSTFLVKNRYNGKALLIAQGLEISPVNVFGASFKYSELKDDATGESKKVYDSGAIEFGRPIAFYEVMDKQAIIAIAAERGRSLLASDIPGLDYRDLIKTIPFESKDVKDDFTSLFEGYLGFDEPLEAGKVVKLIEDKSTSLAGKEPVKSAEVKTEVKAEVNTYNKHKDKHKHNNQNQNKQTPPVTVNKETVGKEKEIVVSMDNLKDTYAQRQKEIAQKNQNHIANGDKVNPTVLTDKNKSAVDTKTNQPVMSFKRKEAPKAEAPLITFGKLKDYASDGFISFIETAGGSVNPNALPKEVVGSDDIILFYFVDENQGSIIHSALQNHHAYKVAYANSQLITAAELVEMIGLDNPALDTYKVGIITNTDKFLDKYFVTKKSA